MTIPSALRTLIHQLDRELVQLELTATQGIDLVRPLLSLFQENTTLIQFFASLNNVLFLVENYRGRIQTTMTRFAEADVTLEETQEVAEELATMLGVLLETKIRVSRIVNRLENLS